MSTTKQEIFIDASSLKSIDCFRRFYLTVVEGLSAKDNYEEHSMSYGNAIHKFLEYFYKGKSMLDSVQFAVDFYRPYHATLRDSPYEFRTITNLIKTCKIYGETYRRTKQEDGTIKLDSTDFQPHIDTKNADTVEYKFCIKLYETDDYILFLTGTVDLVCSYKGFELLLVDHKTTAMAESRSDDFFDGYTMDIQTMLYSMVYKQELKLDYYPPIVINGIFTKKPTLKAEKLGQWDGVTLKRSTPIVYQDTWEFEQWYFRCIQKLKTYIDNKFLDAYQDYSYAACKTVFGNCRYFDVCKLPAKFHRSALDSRYIKKQYNPLHFR